MANLDIGAFARGIKHCLGDSDPFVGGIRPEAPRKSPEEDMDNYCKGERYMVIDSRSEVSGIKKWTTIERLQLCIVAPDADTPKQEITDIWSQLEQCFWDTSKRKLGFTMYDCGDANGDNQQPFTDQKIKAIQNSTVKKYDRTTLKRPYLIKDIFVQFTEFRY